jgi:hypothetical protein
VFSASLFLCAFFVNLKKSLQLWKASGSAIIFAECNVQLIS